MKLRSNGCRVRHVAFPSEAIMMFLEDLTRLLRLTLFPLARNCRLGTRATARTCFWVLASRIRLLVVNNVDLGIGGAAAIAVDINGWHLTSTWRSVRYVCFPRYPRCGGPRRWVRSTIGRVSAELVFVYGRDG